MKGEWGYSHQERIQYTLLRIKGNIFYYAVSYGQNTDHTELLYLWQNKGSPKFVTSESLAQSARVEVSFFWHSHRSA